MVEYYDEERPPSCKITAVVIIIALFLAHEVMMIGLLSSFSSSNPGAHILLFLILSSAIFVSALLWAAKRNERWFEHKFRRDREKEEREYEERRWR